MCLFFYAVFPPSGCFFFVMLWAGSRRQPWKSLLHCPGLYRDLNHLPKAFYERTGSHMSGQKSLDCA